MYMVHSCTIGIIRSKYPLHFSPDLSVLPLGYLVKNPYHEILWCWISMPTLPSRLWWYCWLAAGSWLTSCMLFKVQRSIGLISGKKSTPGTTTLQSRQWWHCWQEVGLVSCMLFKDSKVVTADYQTKWKAQQIQQSRPHKVGNWPNGNTNTHLSR